MNITEIEVEEETHATEAADMTEATCATNTSDASDTSDALAVIRQSALERIDEVTGKIEELKVNDTETAQAAADFINKIAETEKYIDETTEPERKKRYQPYKELLDIKKTLKDLLKKPKAMIRKKLAAYEKEQEKKRLKAQRLRIEAQQEAEGTNPSISVPVIEEVMEDREKISGVSFVETWQFEIEDAAKIPRDYLIPDDKKIRGVVKAMKGDTDIPGVRVFTEKTVRANG